MKRWVLAALVIAAVITLLAWQQQRLALVDTCTAKGGIWDGTASACRPAPQGPIIQRDIRRS